MLPKKKKKKQKIGIQSSESKIIEIEMMKWKL